MIRDWHGVTRGYVRGDGATAGSLRELVEFWLVLDRSGVLAAWGELDDPFATIVRGVRQAPCRTPAVSQTIERREDRAWIDVFIEAVTDVARTARDPVLALGGGVDAAAVLVAWRASGIALPTVATLATGLAEYDEVEPAKAIAGALGVRCEVIEVRPDELVAMARDAVIAAETPLYNLHPVHRLAVAREARRRGATTLVTGDGADAVFAHRPDLDYVPIVAALTRAAGLGLASPFFADAIVEQTLLDPTKRATRDYLRANGLGRVADAPKRSRLLPACDILPVLEHDRLEQLARRLDITLRIDTDRRRVGWLTLDHLVHHLEPG
jgi:asparagine synthetase B (glutamine-hydrolysing)